MADAAAGPKPEYAVYTNEYFTEKVTPELMQKFHARQMEAAPEESLLAIME